jgi:hypothetical protein
LSSEEFPTLEESLAYPILAKEKGAKFVKPRQIMESLSPKDKEIALLKEKLAATRQEQREERRQKLELSEQEKGLTREQLKRKWAEEAQQQRLGGMYDRALTEEERTMSRAALKRKWGAEAQEEWVKRQREMGVPLEGCDGCGKLKRVGDTNHWCRRSNLRFGVGPKQQEVIVSGTSSGIRVSRQTVVDMDQVNKELERLKKLKQQVEDQQRGLMLESPGERRGQDVPMEEVATGSNSLERERKRPFRDGDDGAGGE